MAMHDTDSLLDGRYRPLGPLGAGGMGQVLRVVDLLTSRLVALKQLRSSPLQPVTDVVRLALAHEFQTLASLRHPHVIAVQDYGFDAARQPYFTMELLADAAPVVAAGARLGVDGRVDLLLQLLSALIYIHRRGIVHRDLKPGNVLVSRGAVKVLDFGLAAAAGQASQTTGTLGYMAPELLQGGSASVASDLYAVGVIGYELFAGYHPFAHTANLPLAILQQPPDFSYVDLPEPLAAVLRRLLAKSPADRMADAGAAMAALCAAVGRELPSESRAARESFLQAAPFIGRDAELAQLHDALRQAAAGAGSGWLVSGESGMGKSRLLRELRTRALVDGARVLRGQAKADGGGAYFVWQPVLRQLLLLAQPEELETAVLRPLVPGIAQLLGRPVPPAPPLPAAAAQARLHLTVADLCARAAARQPLLLLLEDLHWADAHSLALLDALRRGAAGRRLLIVGSYRPGERPLLPPPLAALRPLPLARLGGQPVAELSAAILGDAGRQPELVAFLQRESEGNTFFMVEVIRALAAEAGRLDAIRAAALPARVFPDGIQVVVQRRLGRVPAADRPLLQLAAVAGRALNGRLLAHLAPETDLDGWLTTCANAAVLAPAEGGLGWQFSHDKLRDGLLAQLDAAQRQALHRQVGRGLEAVYAADLAPHYPDLVHHFAQAGAVDAQRRYLWLAARQAEADFEPEVAAAWYRQLLPLLSAAAERADVQLRLGRISRLVGAWDAASGELQAALQLAQQALLAGRGAADSTAPDGFVPDAAATRAAVLHALGQLARSRNQHAPAVAWLRQANAAFAALADAAGQCETWVDLGNIYFQQADYETARAYMLRALQPASDSGDAANRALVEHNLGSVAYGQGDYATAETHFRVALSLRQSAGLLPELADSTNNLGLVAYRQGDFDGAQAYFAHSLSLRRRVGDRWGTAAALSNLGMVPYNRQAYADARRFWDDARQIRRALGDGWGLAGSLDNLALVAQAEGDLAEARRLIDEGLALRRELGDRQGLVISLGNRGRLGLQTGAWETAVADYRASLRLAYDIGDRLGTAFALAGVAAVHAARGQAAAAATLLAAAARQLQDMAGSWEHDEQELFDEACRQARRALAPEAYDAAWQVGLALTAEAAVTRALEEAT